MGLRWWIADSHCVSDDSRRGLKGRNHGVIIDGSH